MNYSPELKDALLRRMLPPNNESITKISREEDMSEQTFTKDQTEKKLELWKASEKKNLRDFEQYILKY